MPVYLDEDMVGADPAEICYPHLLLCMGVTVLMSDGSLIGAHTTRPTTEADVMAEMLAKVNAHMLANGTVMNQLYCTGDFPDHCGHHGGMDVAGKAAALNFHGDAYAFDTSSINPQDGTFVAIRSNGPNHKCGIYYKRDEKVRNLYQTGQGPQVSFIKPAGWGKPSQTLAVDSAKTGLTGPIHKLHKASFLLEVNHTVIP